MPRGWGVSPRVTVTSVCIRPRKRAKRPTSMRSWRRNLLLSMTLPFQWRRSGSPTRPRNMKSGLRAYGIRTPGAQAQAALPPFDAEKPRLCLEHTYARISWQAAKNDYQCLQIGHLINQLMVCVPPSNPCWRARSRCGTCGAR
jgi:hypothetical protein